MFVVPQRSRIWQQLECSWVLQDWTEHYISYEGNLLFWVQQQHVFDLVLVQRSIYNYNSYE